MDAGQQQHPYMPGGERAHAAHRAHAQSTRPYVDVQVLSDGSEVCDAVWTALDGSQVRFYCASEDDAVLLCAEMYQRAVGFSADGQPQAVRS